jgi:carbamoyl-phosphate synthase large subunit
MRKGGYVSVKESVLPFNRFPGVDVLLGPEMRSTGEVMGMGASFPEAFLKSQLAAKQMLHKSGRVFIAVKDEDKPEIVSEARLFQEMGFEILATRGTAEFLRNHGIEARKVFKVFEGRPNVVDLMKNHEINLVINTASGKKTMHDSLLLRQTTLLYNIAYSTTVAGAKAMCGAIQMWRKKRVDVMSLQEYYETRQGPGGE